MSNDDKVVKQENPWDVSNIQEFLFYNCPECDVRVKDSEVFVQHALDYHELSISYLDKERVEIVSHDQGEITTDHEMEDIDEKDEDILISAVKTDLDPLSIPDEVSKRKQIIRTREELDSESQKPNIQEKKIAQEELNESQKNLMASGKLEKVALEDNVQEYHSDSDPEFGPVNKKQRRTQKVGTKVQKCPHCTFETDRPSAFKIHTNSFKICSECHEIFCGKRSTQNLKSHLKSHKPKKVFVCEICNKSFQFASALKTHVIRSSCGSAVVHSPTQDKFVLYRTLYE